MRGPHRTSPGAYVAIANEELQGRPVLRFRKGGTISWNDLVPRMPAAIFLGDDGESGRGQHPSICNNADNHGLGASADREFLLWQQVNR
jgi:hypothetical protein